MWPEKWCVRLCCLKVSPDQSVFFRLSRYMLFLDGAPQSYITPKLILTQLSLSQTRLLANFSSFLSPLRVFNFFFFNLIYFCILFNYARALARPRPHRVP